MTRPRTWPTFPPDPASAGGKTLDDPADISLATAKDVTETAELIADAFFTLDATAWLAADSHERAHVLPTAFEIHVYRALTHDEFYERLA